MWEKIDDNTERMHIPNGWIVRCCCSIGYYSTAISMVTIEDKDHIWTISKE
jgi:hypothetical protein